MKQLIRSIYAVALASVVMAGCSKDPNGVTPGGDKSKIVFTSNITPPQSRVDGNKWTYGDMVGVYMLFKGGSIDDPASIVPQKDELNRAENRKFLVNANNGAYMPADESQALFYPLTLDNPDPSHDFDFVAYYPYNAQLDNFKIPVSILENKPVLTATGQARWVDYTDPNATAEPVDLTFVHRMARIKFNIQVGEGMEDADLRNLVITYANANAKGKYNILDNQFEDTPFDEALAEVPFKVVKHEPTAEQKKAGIVVTGSTATLIMIPNKGTKKDGGAAFDIPYRSIVFKVRNNAEPNASGLPTYDITKMIDDDMVYEAGKEYVYNVTIKRDQVVFENIGIDEWEAEPELEVTPDNVEDMDRWRFRRAVYNPNTYIWESKLRTSGNGNLTTNDRFTIPVMKAFSMWENDKWLKTISPANGGGPLPDMTLPENAGKEITAEIIWADNEDVKNYEVFFAEKPVTYLSSFTIRYNVLPVQNAMAIPMNMLVGLKVSGETGYRWAWHVWIVEQNSTPVLVGDLAKHDQDGARDGLLVPISDPNYDPNNPKDFTDDYVFLARNLGARLPNNGVEDMGMFYQWGRPTPFPAAKSYTDPSQHTVLYNAAGQPITLDATGLIATVARSSYATTEELVAAIVHDPTLFVTSADGNWIDPTENTSLWYDNRKSPWDPCPSGWRLPAYKNKYYPAIPMSPWNNPQIKYLADPYVDPMQNPATETTPALYAATFKTDAASKGYKFAPAITTGMGSKYKLGWYPAAGYRSGADGAVTNLGTDGYAWSSSLASDGAQQFFSVNATQIDPYANALNSTASARQVRCIQE